MVKIPDDAIDLSDASAPPNSLIVFFRSDRKPQSFYARKTIPKTARSNPRNPYIFKNLHTVEVKRAEREAIRWGLEIDSQVDRGEPLKPPTFSQVAKHWIDWLEARTKIVGKDGKPLNSLSSFKRYKSCVSVYLIPLLGDKPITAISEEDTEQYLQDRLSFYTDGKGKDNHTIEFVRDGKNMSRPLQTTPPTYSTLAKERVAFNKVFRHARTIMRVRVGQAPPMTIDPENLSPSQVRPDFTSDDWETLANTLESRPYEPKISSETRWFRHLLRLFCWFLYCSGLRVSEAKNLKWLHILQIDRETMDRGALSHLPKEQQSKIIEHMALTGELSPQEFRIRIPANLPGLKSRNHARTVIPLLEMNQVVEDLYDFYVDNEIELGAETPLWLNPDGTRIERFDHAFDRVLKKCGLLQHDGEKRSLTSIRHTYATQRIHSGATRNGLAFLCENMGTTPEMIKKHYNHTLNEIEKDALQRTRENIVALERLMKTP